MVAEFVEEAVEGGGVSTGPAPHHLPANMVSDQSQVVVMFLPGHFIDTQLHKAIKAVWVEFAAPSAMDEG